MNLIGKVSPAFTAFTTEAPRQSKAWMEMVQSLSAASTLDPKTQTLAYLAVLAAQRMESGIPFHVAHAKQMGISREDVISAILTGLPAAGHAVTQVLPLALKTFDEA